MCPVSVRPHSAAQGRVDEKREKREKEERKNGRKKIRAYSADDEAPALRENQIVSAL